MPTIHQIDSTFVPELPHSRHPECPVRHDRTPGLHLYDVMSYIEYTLGNSKESGWDMDTTREVGFLWEDILTYAFRLRRADPTHCPGEIVYDGIIFSPDGVGPDVESPDNLWVTRPLVLEEYKATWTSSLRPLTDNWRYMVQTKSYCKILGIAASVMRILYINGDYRGSGPQYRVARVEFTQDEIDMNWRMIIEHRDRAAEWVRPKE